jgi:Holliday junction resolvase-like predicted endonuclease
MLRRVFRNRSPKEILKEFYRQHPGIEEGIDEFLKAMEPYIDDRAQISAIVLAFSDQQLPSLFTFSHHEIANLSGLDLAKVEAIVSSFAHSPGELEGKNLEHIFLENPVWIRPLVKVGEGFVFCCLPQVFFSFVHEAIEGVLSEIGETDVLKERRAKFLEEKIFSLAAKALPDAKITKNLRWKWQNQNFETDIIVEFDRYLLIIEAKSGSVSSPALRGAIDRAKRQVEKLIIEPSIQSARLMSIFEKAWLGDEEATASLTGHGFDLNNPKNILTLSVTLADFNSLAALEPVFREVGWLQDDHKLAVNMNVADFDCVLDILGSPAHLFNYLSERARLQQSFMMYGDELEWLGLYCETGFNFGDVEDEVQGLVMHGMSAKIDQYHVGLEAGLKVEKPRPKITKLRNTALNYLQSNAPIGWTRLAVETLKSAPFEGQRRAEREFGKICARVPKNWRTEGHINSLLVTPPRQRDTALLFYAYPMELAKSRHAAVEATVEKAFEAAHIKRCLVFGRQVPSNASSFSFVMAFQK